MLRSRALLLVLVMACEHPASIAQVDLDAELQQARCAHLARCKMVSDEASCMALLRVVPDPSVAAAIAAHKIDYDGERARACVAATAAQSCDVTSREARIPPIACVEMYRGRVADGEPCSIDVECASGTCDLPRAECPDTGCCVGTCRAARSGGAGDPCSTLRECRDGLVCGQDMQCRAPAAAGGVCHVDIECDDGLACVGGSGDIPGACRALPRVGEPCPYQRCAEENLRCDPDTHTCVPVGLRGDPCPRSTECTIHMECDATTQRCRDYPTLGMPCEGTCTGDSFCALGAGAAGTCVALLANNTPCDGDQQCASSLCEEGPVFRSCVDLHVCF